MKKVIIPATPDTAQMILDQNPVLKIAFQHVMLKAGILPITSSVTDVNRIMNQQGLSEDDQRVLKRKFRKLWRSAAKRVNDSESGTHGTREAKAVAQHVRPIQFQTADSEPNRPRPNRFHKEARKTLVFMSLRPEIQQLSDAMINSLNNKKKELTL